MIRTPGTAKRDETGPSALIRIALVVVILVSTVAAIGAATRLSAVYDEVTMIGAGARGWSTGEWDYMIDHPPLIQYLHALPMALVRPTVPIYDTPDMWRDRAILPAEADFFGPRYRFAQQLIWGSGNNPELLTFAARIVTIPFLAALLLLTFYYVNRYWAARAGFLATVMVACMPDTLAHGAIAYFDIPLSFAFLLALAVLDRAIRKPSWKYGIAAGIALAFALSVKFTSILLLPVGICLIALEAAGRRADLQWWKHCGQAALIAVVTAYVGLMVVYRGDVSLEEFRFGLGFTARLGAQGHPYLSMLLGSYYASPPWFAYPVVLFFKTPVALHVLWILGGIGLMRRLKTQERAKLLTSHLRVPVVGALAIGASLVWSDAQLASRYALPLMVCGCILAGVGVNYLWETGRPAFRITTSFAAVWMAVATLSIYPHFLAYTNEWGGSRDEGWRLFSGSNLDWGQGLLDLRSWMRENDQEYVYLSYFGAAVPAGYGIRYLPLQHAGALPEAWPSPANSPRYAVISSQFIIPNTVGDDPFRRYREQRPVAVIGHVLSIYDIAGNP